MLAWKILQRAAKRFLAHGALSRGAAISFYTVTSFAPILLIVVAVAGLVFGQDAVRGSLVTELGGIFGKQGGELIQTMLSQSSDKTTGVLATIFGAFMLLVTVSGVFGEMQTALNATWEVPTQNLPWDSLIRARAASLGLVAALGFSLIVSLAASAGLSAVGGYLGANSVFAPVLLALVNTVISVGLFAILFSAIFRILPDTAIAWRDVFIGGLITAVLFTTGKSLIGWYLGTTSTSSAYGASGGLILILLWAYYSAQIVLFGAELTHEIEKARAPARLPNSNAYPGGE